jgi:hypothetical protein
MEPYATRRDVLLTSLLAALPLNLTSAATTPLNPAQTIICDGKRSLRFLRAAPTFVVLPGTALSQAFTMSSSAGIRDT